MPKKPAWMEEEEERAEETADTGKTANANAPKMVKVHREPSRKQKAFYVQDTYAEAFDELVFRERKKKTAKGPQLIEEALIMLFKKYGVDTSKL